MLNWLECRKEISDTIENYPHCRFIIRPKAEVRNKKERNVFIFQMITIIFLVIALFAPQFFLNFFVLNIIASAIIALLRKEKRWGILCELRELKNHLQCEVISLIEGVDDAFISKIKQNEKILNRNHLHKVSKFFNDKKDKLQSFWLDDKLRLLVEDEAHAVRALNKLDRK